MFLGIKSSEEAIPIIGEDLWFIVSEQNAFLYKFLQPILNFLLCSAQPQRYWHVLKAEYIAHAYLHNVWKQHQLNRTHSKRKLVQTPKLLSEYMVHISMLRKHPETHTSGMIRACFPCYVNTFSVLWCEILCTGRGDRVVERKRSVLFFWTVLTTANGIDWWRVTLFQIQCRPLTSCTNTDELPENGVETLQI